MAKPKRPQHPTTAGTSRTTTSGGNTRPATARIPAVTNGRSATAPTTTPARATKPANGMAPATRGSQYGRNGGNGSTGVNGVNGKTGSGSGSTAARAIASRAGSQRNQRRRQPQQSAWQRTFGGQRGVWIALAGVAVVVAAFVIIAQINGGGSDRQAVPTTLYHQVTQVSPSVLAQVGTGGLDAPFKATPAGSKLLTSGGKPELLYVGAEYCPHCAAERWSMVVALSRFGTFSNLRLTKSMTADTPPDVPTFTFYKSTYTSPYLTFTPVETQDRLGNNLESLSAEQNQIFTTFDNTPYSSTAQAIPFLDLGNQYIQVGEGFPSTLIASDTWQSIGNDLGNPSTPESQNILGNANYLTAAICQMTNNQPASVCTAAPIPGIQQKLPKGS